MSQPWQPTADITQLKQRAILLATIRQFFADRDVIEVDTPAMSQATVTDVHLHAFKTQFVGPGYANGQTLYLMTSPEFHMKRLLAAGSGAIYQICKSFRNEESGRYHNPEFTMLEWLLQLLFSVGVEAKIGQTVPAFVYDFPASQAALAQINPQDPRVAERFEVYFKGIELANGFHELANGDEQLQRFEDDNKKRVSMGLQPQPIDMHLVEALRAGFPDCAGVALGIDRVIMLALERDHIDQVTAFPIEIA
jgi:elongation factor P--beta-lysine ligase